MKNKSCKILDCTLRDGGYIIDWSFGKSNIAEIMNNLELSGIDYIEAGFLKESETAGNENNTFWSSPDDLTRNTPKDQNYTLMVNYGEYSLSNFEKCKNQNIKIRVAFKKQNQTEALEYIKELKTLGWDVFANPMSTNTYSDDELLNLIKKINEISPLCLSIVDTLGNTYEAEVLEIIRFIDKNLNPDIAIGFHPHNSLQLSFSNTEAILKADIKHNLIIDSCLYGMGRGAGNLCTELITKYINDNCGGKYNLLPLLKTIDKNIKPIHEKTPWGYSTAYFIAAIHSCHPNYAAYLIDLGLADEEIDRFMRQIPQEKKSVFDKNFIASITQTQYS